MNFKPYAAGYVILGGTTATTRPSKKSPHGEDPDLKSVVVVHPVGIGVAPGLLQPAHGRLAESTTAAAAATTTAEQQQLRVGVEEDAAAAATSQSRSITYVSLFITPLP
jgi:hypothetical protein